MKLVRSLSWLVFATAFAAAGFMLIVAVASAQSPIKPTAILREGHIADVQTELTQTVFLPAVLGRYPGPPMTFTSRCEYIKFGGYYYSVFGSFTNSFGSAIAQAKIRVTVYDVTGTAIATQTTQASPTTTLPQQVSLFVAFFSAEPFTNNCNPSGRVLGHIEANVSEWDTVSETKLKPLNVISSTLIGADPIMGNYLVVTVRNDQNISLTQISVTSSARHFIRSNNALTTVLAPGSTMTLAMGSGPYDGFIDPPIAVAQGVTYP